MPFLRTPCLSDSATPSMAARQAFLSFISQRLLKLISTELLMSSNHLILCHPLLLLPSLFPASGSFLMSLLFTSDSQSIGASASASVLWVNIQGWFPLGLTDLSPCSPRDTQESSPASQCESIHYLVLSLLFGPTLTSTLGDYWKIHSFDYMYLCWQNDFSV